MIKGILSLYKPTFPKTITYMLQSSEYKAGAYLEWFWRTNNFDRVVRRRELQLTRPARLLRLALLSGMLAQIVTGIGLLYLSIGDAQSGGIEFGIALLVSYPIIWAHLIVLPLIAGDWFLIKPTQKRHIRHSRNVFAKHPGIIIAVAGSYGKTTMKELLLTVLSEGKTVAATPANKNVAISHARFAKTLNGKEDVLIIEYGEGAPGDVRKFAKNTKPTIGVITGLAPAHLDKYKTLQRAGKDIFSLAKYLGHRQVYIAADSQAVQPFIKPGDITYDSRSVLGWRISKVQVSVKGLGFVMKKGERTLNLSSGLLGRHQVGPLAFVAALADQLGLSPKQIERGIAKTTPFEHRMQPRQLGGGWLIDDTYNGNIDGIRAGLELLKELPARKKIYVTPGLVDQGRQTKQVHQHIGKLIAETRPDEVVLMKNSVTKYIQTGMKAGNFKGGCTIEEDPLFFYNNIEQFAAKDVLILMQNDWTDNYA